MLGKVSLGDLLQLVLRQRVILVWHPDVIEDIGIAALGGHDPVRYLRVLVRILVDQFELAGRRVVIDLKVISGEFPRLESDALDQPSYLVVVRVEGHVLICHVIYTDCLVLRLPLDGAHAGQRADPPGIDLFKDHLPLNDTVFRVPLQVFQGRGQAEIVGAIFGSVDITGTSLGIEPGEELLVFFLSFG